MAESEASDQEGIGKLVRVWQAIIQGDKKSWVMFENGTCVILMKPEEDLKAQATEIMKDWGPVHAGSPAGDFNVIPLKDYPGWVVTGHHRDMLNYVGPEEFEPDADHVGIGLYGRNKRDMDAESLRIVHVEDKR